MSETSPPRASTATIASWTEALAQPHGDPGGGAASGVMLSFAASLVSMVAGYSAAERFADAPTDAGWDDERAAVASRAGALRREALALADGDAEASGGFATAFALEAGSDEHHAAVRVAALRAAEASARIGEAALPLIDDLAWLRAHGNPAVGADVTVAGAALLAALLGARTNVAADLELHDATPAPTGAPSAPGAADTATPGPAPDDPLRALIGRLDTAIGRLERAEQAARARTGGESHPSST